MLICQPRGASQSVAEVRLVQLRRNAKLALGQSKLSLGPLVGVPFGTNFLVEHSCRSGADFLKNPIDVIFMNRTFQEIGQSLFCEFKVDLLTKKRGMGSQAN